MTVQSLIACDILPLNEKLWVQINTRSLWGNSKFNLAPQANFIGENENKWGIKRITLIIHHSSNCSNKLYTSNKLRLNFSKWMEIQEKKLLCPILCRKLRVSVKENPNRKKNSSSVFRLMEKHRRFYILLLLIFHEILKSNSLYLLEFTIWKIMGGS